MTLSSLGFFDVGISSTTPSSIIQTFSYLLFSEKIICSGAKTIFFATIDSFLTVSEPKVEMNLLNLITL